MRYILLLFIFFAFKGYGQDSAIARKCNLKNYYFYWEGDFHSKRFPGRYSWGENDFCVDHKPTKAEVWTYMKTYLTLNKPYDKTIKIKIIEETGLPCTECMSSDSVSVKKKAF